MIVNQQHTRSARWRHPASVPVAFGGWARSDLQINPGAGRQQ